MAFTSGFFNAINEDRKYNAEQFGSIFDGIIVDGVFGTIGEKFKVTSPQNGFKVQVGTGRAWFLHTWSYNSSAKTVTLSNPEVLLDRIDAIVLDIDHRQDYRTNSIQVVKGTAASNPQRPTWTNTDVHKKVALAYVRVRANSTTISPSDITNMVGTSSCPYVTGPLQTINADQLLAQWDTEFHDWLDRKEAEVVNSILIFNTFLDEKKGDVNTAVNAFNNWIDGRKSDVNSTITSFNNWVDGKEAEVVNSITIFNTELDRKKGEVNTAVNAFNNWIDGRKSDVNKLIDRFNTWLAELRNMLLDMSNQMLRDWISHEKEKYSEFINHNYTAWINWFTHIQYELDGDVAGHLQEQIDWIKKFASIYTVGKTLYIPMSGASVKGKKLIFAQ